MRIRLLGGLTLLVFTLGLNAGSVGPNDCVGDCFGGVYSLNGVLQSTSGTQETWKMTYTLDLTGYNGPAQATYVGSLAAHVVDAANFVSANTSSDGKPTSGVWEQKLGTLASPGCNSAGGGWVCLQWISGDQLLVGPGTPTYAWMFDVTIKAGTLKNSDSSIKANFDPPNGLLLSETVMLEKISIPEGAAGELPLLLGGLALLLWRTRSYLRPMESSRIN